MPVTSVSLTSLQKSLYESAQLLTSETVQLGEALHRITSGDICATTNMPTHATSAMDGYALNHADVQINTPITQSQCVYAGTPATPLQPSTCARVFTGSLIPEGANTVVIQENVTTLENSIVCATLPTIGKHIRQPGSVLLGGQKLLAKAQPIQPQHLQLLASQGIDNIQVRRKPILGILSTGDELVPIGNTIQPWQIYNSNSIMLNAIFANLGCIINKQIHIKDNQTDISNSLQMLSEKCDLIVTSGGASVGDRDFIHQCVAHVGQVHQWKVAMRPGKPFIFGHIHNTPILGLPGNPLSACMTALLCVRPLLAGMFGIAYNASMPKPIRCISGFHYVGDTNREQFLQVIRCGNVLKLAGKQLSDQLLSLATASGIATLAKAQTINQGEQLDYVDYAHLLHW